MKFFLSRTTFVILTLLISMIGASAQRAVPDDHLAFPVLFTTKANFGSGFYLSTESAIYFVTARHVIFDLSRGELVAKSAQLLSHASDSKIDRDNFFVLDLAEMQTRGLIKSNPKNDAVVVKLGAFSELLSESFPPEHSRWFNYSAGVSAIRTAPGGVLGAGKGDFVKYDDVLIGNDLFVWGYPNSIGLVQIPQVDSSRPLLRKGTIAGKNAALRTIIADVTTFPGNSGGPAVQVTDTGLGGKKFQIIGLVSQFVPFDNARFNLPLGEKVTILNSGYSVITPIDTVLDLVREDEDIPTGSIKKQ
jgi:Trypsin-like peptidase domain